MYTHLTKRATVYMALLLALFWVMTIWGIFEKGPFALGWNLTVFTAGVTALYMRSCEHKFTKHELIWFIPLALVALSYSLYENPFIKMVNMLVLPSMFAAYWIITSTRNHRHVVWNLRWIQRLIERMVGVVTQLERAVSMIMHAMLPGGKERSDLAKRIALGLGIFAIAAAVLFIPLLSSADTEFARIMQDFYDFVVNLVAIATIMKIIVFIALSLGILAALIHWTREEEFTSRTETKHMDAIVSGIVLGGILLLYLLFLFTQLTSLWVYELPAEFTRTEQLVKSGFWQLFFLSGVNVLLFLLYYRRTSKHVQTILKIFMLASLLLLLSAAKRMGMYVFYYGFSYEKFFAAYTVVFAVFLFIRLITALFRREKTDILRYLVLTFAWMYAVATVLPVEQIIFRANRALAKRPDSRIHMHELQMLSGDAFNVINEEAKATGTEAVWAEWLQQQRDITESKAFHEMTLTDLLIRLKAGHQ